MGLSVDGYIPFIQLHHPADCALHFGQIDIQLHPPRTPFLVVLKRHITQSCARPESGGRNGPRVELQAENGIV